MHPLWLLKGEHDAPGWRKLEQDARAKTADVELFDRDAWALVRADVAPEGYEGMVATVPPDGLYLSHTGEPCYVVDRKVVKDGRIVIRALGPEAEAMLEKLGDPELVLERLGRMY